MSILVVQHAEDCPPGRVGAWLTAGGCRLSLVRADRGEELPPALDAYDGVLVLGGPMGVYDDPSHPWLTPTKRLLAAAVERTVPTLGICLGHQLLAVATGGVVAPAADGLQGGVWPIGVTSAAADDLLLADLPADAAGVHWNNDLVVELPAGAVELARTTAGVQALRVGPAAWGLQWHPEADGTLVRRWAEADVASAHLEPPRAAAWLEQIRVADRRLVATWSAVAGRFARLVRRPRPTGPRPASPAPGRRPAA